MIIMVDNKRIRFVLAAAVVLIICYLSFKYIVPFLIPFAIAFAVSKIIRPLSSRIRTLSPALDKPVTVSAIILLTMSVFAVLYFAGSIFVSQLNGLFSSLSNSLSSPDGIMSELLNRIRNAFPDHPLINKLISGGMSADGIISEMVRKTLSDIGGRAAELAGALFSQLPSAFVSFFITLSATFYFSLDRGEIKSFFNKLLPSDFLAVIEKRKKAISTALSAYFKTHLLIMLLVFSVLYAGLSLLGVEYALVKSMLIAFIDILPILGVGTVLIPWTMGEVILGNTGQAIGIAALLIVVTVTREIAEPKIMGDKIGVPPIIALISVYLGMKLFGVTGLILFPILVSVVFSVVNETKNEKTPTEVEVSSEHIIIPSV